MIVTQYVATIVAFRPQKERFFAGSETRQEFRICPFGAVFRHSRVSRRKSWRLSLQTWSDSASFPHENRR